MTHHEPRHFESLKSLLPLVGEEIGTSDWMLIDQPRIDAFAQATGDLQWIHVDPERAADGPYGTTVAHGFLTLSLIPAMQAQAFAVGNVELGINYGLNKVRFPAPVPVGSRVRGRFRLSQMEEAAPVGGMPGYQLTVEVAIEVEGGTKPACVAYSVTRRYARVTTPA